MRSALLLLLLTPAAAAQAKDPPSVSDWAQLLEDGAWAVSLRMEVTAKEGMRDGREDFDDARLIAEGYPVATDSLDEHRQTLHLAHGLADCTLYLSLPLVQLERRGRALPGAPFSGDVDGVGDLTLGLTRAWRRTDRGTLVWSLAASLPTGKVDEPGEPYPMQPGSGTFDLLPGASWVLERGHTHWGLALRGRLPLGENGEGWARSRSLVADAWFACELRPGLSARVGLRNSSWGDVHGEAADLAFDPDPLADDDLQGGTRTDLLLGVDWSSDSDRFRFGLEGGVPVDEWLDGPQPSTDLLLALTLRVGW